MDLLNGVSSDKQILVSVIVPVYNVENYLKRCLTSLLAQTLKDIEIILVDDGSEDQSGAICDAYAVRDNRIRVVHKANGGLSSARNAGMAIASGKYLGFVDSDDEIETDMYAQMSAVALQYDTDCVMADYLRIEDKTRSKKYTEKIPDGYYDKARLEELVYPSLIMGTDIEYGPILSVCRCLFKTDFIRENVLSFDEEVRWSEDNMFSAQMGYCCNTFYYMKGQFFYHYYHNPGTITTSYRKGAWKVYNIMNEHLRSFFQDAQGYDFQDQLNYHLIYYACVCIGQTKQLSRKVQQREIADILNTESLISAFAGTHFDSRIGWKLKVQLYLMKFRFVHLVQWMVNR